MKALFDIFRKRPDESDSYRQTFKVAIEVGVTLLEVFHTIQEEQDPSFAYRYSCRGAICGSCAVRINGQAALACKTQVLPLAQKGAIIVDPLTNMPTIKDLVSDHDLFWQAYKKVRPYLERLEDAYDPSLNWQSQMKPQHYDQLSRSIDCIKCASCFSDCPKRAEDDNFIGPQASAQLYKLFFDPRDGAKTIRTEIAGSEGGVGACDSHANCVKVCPKDVRPLRAINFIKQELPS